MCNMCATGFIKKKYVSRTLLVNVMWNDPLLSSQLCHANYVSVKLYVEDHTLFCIMLLPLNKLVFSPNISDVSLRSPWPEQVKYL